MEAFTFIGDPAPFIRQFIVGSWRWNEYRGNDYVYCTTCDQTATEPIGLVHDPKCPVSKAAHWLQENNK